MFTILTTYTKDAAAGEIKLFPGVRQMIPSFYIKFSDLSHLTDAFNSIVVNMSTPRIMAEEEINMPLFWTMKTRAKVRAAQVAILGAVPAGRVGLHEVSAATRL
jgi:hypothetical protein